jgi:hypothetical protein
MVNRWARKAGCQREGKGLSDGTYLNPARFATAHRDSRAMDCTFHRSAKRGAAKVLQQLARDKTHFAKTRGNAVHSLDPNDLGTLSGLQLIEGCGQGTAFQFVSILRTSLSKESVVAIDVAVKWRWTIQTPELARHRIRSANARGQRGRRCSLRIGPKIFAIRGSDWQMTNFLPLNSSSVW